MTNEALDDQDAQSDDAVTEGSGTDVLAAREGQVRNALTALHDAEAQIMGLLAAVKSIRKMMPDVGPDELFSSSRIDVGFVPFSHVGKEIRNSMLADLYTNLEAVEDSIKAAWRASKAVKRSRLTDEQIDDLIMGTSAKAWRE